MYCNKNGFNYPVENDKYHFIEIIIYFQHLIKCKIGRQFKKAEQIFTNSIFL